MRPDEVGRFYEQADIFTLASVEEAFGRVYIEAMLHGLPCVPHDFPVSRFVLGDEGIFADMTATGDLARVLDQLLRREEEGGRARRLRVASGRFGWQALIPDYLELLLARR